MFTNNYFPVFCPVNWTNDTVDSGRYNTAYLWENLSPLTFTSKDMRIFLLTICPSFHKITWIERDLKDDLFTNTPLHPSQAVLTALINNYFFI